jgi:hypothetical protein
MILPRKLVVGTVACLLALALLMLPYGAGLWLLFGWITFPFRVLPGVSVDWPGVVVGCAAVVLFTAGVHWLGRTWRRSRAEAGAAPWKLRWSLTVVAVVFLLFVAGTAMIAVTHQVTWLATSSEPIAAPGLKYAGLSGNNLRVMGMAMHNHADAHEGSLPNGGTFRSDGTMLHSWETDLLLFIGFSTKDIHRDLPWNHPRNARPFSSVVPTFINGQITGADLRDVDGYGLSHYAANSWVLGANRGMKLEDITDGQATTLLVGEVNANFRPWGHPVNYRDPTKGINRSPHGFGGVPGRRGAIFVMVDGSMRFISDRVSPEVLRALSTPRGGEKIDEDAWDANR